MNIRQIASIRKEKGLTQTELANQAGVSRATICRIERGRKSASSVSFGDIQRIMAILGYATDFKVLNADKVNK